MKCKVGDLAWIIGGVNNRKLVEVVEWWGDCNVWRVRSLQGPIPLRDVNGEYTRMDDQGFAADENLDPIRPPKITETETIDELEGVL